MVAKVSVVVVNWNGRQCLIQCLEALRRQSFQNKEVMVVDNGSDDGSVETVKHRFPEVILMALPENLGFSAANNLAIQRIQTEYIALLNNDAIPHPCWLETLINALGRYPQAGFAASKMLFQDLPNIIDRAGDSYTRAGTGSLRGRGQSAAMYCQPEWIFGACAGAALYRKSMLDEIGLLDEDFFLLYEDVDLSFRAQLKGYPCRYVPDAIVYHQATRTIGYDSPKSVYYGHRNLEWVYFQNLPASLLAWMAIPHLVYTIGAFGFFCSKGLAIPFLRAKWDAIKAWKTVLKKRKIIQSRRRVGNEYIWALLEKERSFSRLSHRLKRKQMKEAVRD